MSIRNILRLSGSLIRQRSINKTISIIPTRFSSYRSSEHFSSIDQHPEVEVVQNPPEWKYVEYLLGSSTIPKPTTKANYPSGWSPPDSEKLKKLQYFVTRTKNFMLPVYLEITFRGTRRCSIVKNIEGDIWQLQEELAELIERKSNKPCYSRVNEMNRQIKFRGDFVTLIQKYLVSKGL